MASAARGPAERRYGQLGRGEPVRLPPKTTSFRRGRSAAGRYAERTELRGRAGVLARGACGARPKLCRWTEQVGRNRARTTRDGRGRAGRGGDAGAARRRFRAAYRTRRSTDVLLTALRGAFAQWTGRRSSLLDLEGHGREEVFEGVDLSRTVGWFTTIYPVPGCRRGGGPREDAEGGEGAASEPCPSAGSATECCAISGGAGRSSRHSRRRGQLQLPGSVRPGARGARPRSSAGDGERGSRQEPEARTPAPARGGRRGRRRPAARGLDATAKQAHESETDRRAGRGGSSRRCGA